VRLNTSRPSWSTPKKCSEPGAPPFAGDGRPKSSSVERSGTLGSGAPSSLTISGARMATTSRKTMK
jgi:hypothetical protein